MLYFLYRLWKRWKFSSISRRNRTRTRRYIFLCLIHKLINDIRTRKASESDKERYTSECVSDSALKLNWVFSVFIICTEIKALPHQGLSNNQFLSFTVWFICWNIRKMWDAKVSGKKSSIRFIWMEIICTSVSYYYL